jgi:hypothetical protein
LLQLLLVKSPFFVGEIPKFLWIDHWICPDVPEVTRNDRGDLPEDLARLNGHVTWSIPGRVLGRGHPKCHWKRMEVWWIYHDLS